MPGIRGIILDVDGTLVDSNDAHAHAWVEALERGGYKVEFGGIRRLIGMGGDNLLPTAVNVDGKGAEGKQLSEWWKEIFEEKYLPELKAFPDTRKLLEKMKAEGMKLVVASSSEEELLKKLLKIAGADGLLEEATSSDDAENSKPDPDIIKVALQSLGYSAGETVMIGDTPYDIEAASKIGVPVIAFRCGGWNSGELKGAIVVYDDPSDLLAHYDQSPLGSG